MSKIIWIDLDEVLAETIDYCLHYNNYKVVWLSIKRHNIKDYYIHKMDEYDITLDEAIDWFRQPMFSDDKLEIKPLTWAKESLIKLKNDWYILKIVTARMKNLLSEYTQNWIDQHYPNIFTDIIYVNNSTLNDNKTKWELCNEYWIKHMIEDNPDYALELAHSWVTTYLLEKPWNIHRKEEHKNLIKIKSWEEFSI